MYALRKAKVPLDANGIPSAWHPEAIRLHAVEQFMRGRSPFALEDAYEKFCSPEAQRREQFEACVRENHLRVALQRFAIN